MLKPVYSSKTNTTLRLKSHLSIFTTLLNKFNGTFI